MRLECVPDDRSGAGKESPVIRAKEYLKEGYPLDAYTPIPDVASRCLGCTWRQANRVALVDTVPCNMDCWYCYQKGRSKESTNLDAFDLAREFPVEAANSPVWRVSGGEPTLEPDLLECLDYLCGAAGVEHLVWLNTNGLLVEPLARDLAHLDNLVVEVSLKGFSNDMAAENSGLPETGVLSTQLDAVQALQDEGVPTMLNVVCGCPAGNHFAHGKAAVSLVKRLREIHYTLPLRATPVVLKRYDWNPEWPTVVNLTEQWRAAVQEVYCHPGEWVDLASPPASFLGLGSFERAGVW